MKRTTVMLNPEAVKQAQRLGAARGLTTSHIIRMALSNWIRRETAIASAFKAAK